MIAGTNFGSTQGTSTVKFNGTTATAIGSWSSTSITATVPAGATTGNVVVTVNNVASNGVAFTVVAAPHINSLAPTSGAVGTSVTISGTNFGASQGNGSVKFNGTTATGIGSWTNTSITATVPVGATTGNVVVTAAGGVASNGISFTVLASTPTISSLTPNSAAVGSAIVIAGTNFGSTQGTSTVKFNGTTATAIGNWSSTSITATVPAGATTGNVVVTVNNVASNGVAFTVVAAPAISSLSVPSASVGASVTISGTNFGASQGNGSVKFNGTTATGIGSWTNTSITATVPVGATTGNVVVTAAGGVASNGISFTVLGTPTVTLSTSLTPSTWGSNVTFTATVSGNTLTPTGSVTFRDGTTTIGTGALSAGKTTLSISSLAAGAHSITALYAGDGNYTGAQSSVLTQNISVAQSSLALVSSITTPSPYGNPIVLTATVAPTVITGTVTFLDGTVVLGTAPISGGQASFTTTTLDIGSHSISASIAGSSNFLGSTSVTLTVPVAVGQVTITVSCPTGTTCGSSVFGDTVSLNIAVAAVHPNPKLRVPTGTVELVTCSAFPLSSEATLVNGAATASTSKLTGGSTTICASYLSDNTFYLNDATAPLGSAGQSLAWVVNPAPSSTALTSTPNPSLNSQTVTLTATVTGRAGAPASPTGNVIFNDSFNGANTQLGKVTLDASGKATSSPSPLLAPGQHSITAVYNADGTDKNYASSTSAPVLQVVNVGPAITLFQPIGGGPIGMSFDIVGINFGTSPGTVKFNGTAIAASDILQWSDTKIVTRVQGIIPAPSTATPIIAVPVIVNTSDGKTSAPVNFNVTLKLLP